MAGIVVVFDFDKTIIECDSDNWVVDELGATDLFNQLLPTMPWNSLMDRMMEELHSQGKTIEDIAEVLKRTPIHPRVVPAIKAAHALGCDLRIVSDANLFFIETILKHLGLEEYFSEINTNPSYVDEEGRLRISPHHDFTKFSHGCSLCPPNMCKVYYYYYYFNFIFIIINPQSRHQLLCWTQFQKAWNIFLYFINTK
ncbi:PREDICTED: inorganic pyrophosphatase [Prunus dulcis]|uniref:PREDICTED: inorganic pyrophosphatase n=1 Tax=Prunus dulcis TaxID=3755 RepID=A0A5E4F8D1_PRUDU|nr:PREDICTED: inorganic pyrophosphatase [Prunus dulcis]